MPEKSLTIAAYAGAASLAAATLVYVFGPTFFLDDVHASNARNGRKRVAIGLTNPANDCYLNATVQALAGLPALRLYLIHELHQRQLDGKEIYLDLGLPEEKEDSTIEKARPDWLQVSLQSGTVTAALKEILDALNERPLAKKTISAQPFITAVEQAFRTRVSRYQQDAQEFLQLVLERLSDEHYAGVKARGRARKKDEKIVEGDVAASIPKLDLNIEESEEGAVVDEKLDTRATGAQELSLSREEVSQKPAQNTLPPKLPLEGKIESLIECEVCHFKPKPAVTAFVTLTLNVPQQSGSTSLDACLDGMFKVEHIDDFRCDRCRLDYALQLIAQKLKKTTVSDETVKALKTDQVQILNAIETDPEHPPKDLVLPDAASSPKRRISRHMRIAVFPQILAIHLSRSMWDSYSSSSKNLAKVTYPELLQMGSLLDRKTYRLLAVITHKGGHDSGHYETWRRQWLAPAVVATGKGSMDSLDVESTPNSPRPESADTTETKPVAHAESSPASSETSVQAGEFAEPRSSTSITQSPRLKATSQAKLAERRRKAQDRWWRISDDKVKECKLSDVLGMRSEVYMIFYELVVS